MWSGAGVAEDPTRSSPPSRRFPARRAVQHAGGGDQRIALMDPAGTVDAAAVVERADAAGLRLVRFLWCGNDGTVRAKASSRHGLEGRIARGHRRDGRDAGDERARPAPAASRAWGRSARSGSCRTPTRSACCRTPRARARCSPTSARWTASRRRSTSAAFLKRMAGAAGRARRCGSRWRSRTSSRSPPRDEDGDYVAGRREPLLLDDRDDGGAGLRRRARRRARGAGDPARAVLRRARPRPAGDLDRAPPGAPGRRRADPRARDDPRRRRGARARRVAGAEAVARRRRQRRPHPLLAVGRGGERNRFYDPAAPDGFSAEGARVPRRRARAPARPVRPDRAELQLLPPHRAAALGGRVHAAGATTTARRRCGCRRRSAGMEEASTNLELKAADATATRTSRSAA